MCTVCCWSCPRACVCITGNMYSVHTVVLTRMCALPPSIQEGQHVLHIQCLPCALPVSSQRPFHPHRTQHPGGYGQEGPVCGGGAWAHGSSWLRSSRGQRRTLDGTCHPQAPSLALLLLLTSAPEPLVGAGGGWSLWKVLEPCAQTSEGRQLACQQVLAPSPQDRRQPLRQIPSWAARIPACIRGSHYDITTVLERVFLTVVETLQGKVSLWCNRLRPTCNPSIPMGTRSSPSCSTSDSAPY